MKEDTEEFKMNITKGQYNKTICEDGIRHVVDTSRDYDYYKVDLSKTYFNIKNRNDLISSIKADLLDTIRELEKLEEKEGRDDR